MYNPLEEFAYSFISLKISLHFRLFSFFHFHFFSFPPFSFYKTLNNNKTNPEKKGILSNN
jgi:hypothetical protein